MPEIKKAISVVEVNYACDTGDGGWLIYDGAPTKDELQENVWHHRCTNEKDKTIYPMKLRYPRLEYQEGSP